MERRFQKGRAEGLLMEWLFSSRPTRSVPMKKLLRPAALLFYLLVIPSCFMPGLGYVFISGSAEGQGLAGGAIVFMTGLFSALIGFVLAIFLAQKMEVPRLIRVNKVLGVIVLICAGMIAYRIWDKSNEQINRPEINRPQTMAL